MKTPKFSKLIVAILILQSIAGVVIFIFLYSYVSNPNSEFNRNIQSSIKSYAESFKPISSIGIQGEKGDRGEPGEDGISIKGDKGDKGDPGERGADGLSIVGPRGEKGEPGEAGPQGAKGDPGPRPEFRCNSETAQEEYKYSDNEDWITTGGTCTPIGENNGSE